MDQEPSQSDTPVQPARGGILLAGPPASGKRTVALALSSLRRGYAHVSALTTATQPVLSAVPTSQRYLDDLSSWAQLFYEFRVEGARYVYDRERLDRLRGQGRLPVVCVEDIDALSAFERESGDWLPVLVWCPREHARDRLTLRRAISERSAIITRSWTRRWDQSFKELYQDGQRFTMTLRTDRSDAVEIARIVHLAAQAHALAAAGPSSGQPAGEDGPVPDPAGAQSPGSNQGAS